jgi:iron complex outermembrane receptor protein
MRLSHAHFLATASLLAALATPALAQEAPQPVAQTGIAPGDDSGIIVTARRQNERLQDVPASVAVLTADALQRTGAVKAEDFVKLTPGITIVTGTAEAGDTQINIRGMNGARDAESSVALVVDGILKTNTAQLNQPQGTLQQVELLKGRKARSMAAMPRPGPSSSSRSSPPTALPAAKLSYADYNTWEASAHVAGPVADNVGFVLAGYYYKTDGFYKNTFTNSKTVDDKENWAIDGRVMVGQGGPTQLDLKARYSEFHGASLPFNAAFHLPGFGGAFYETSTPTCSTSTTASAPPTTRPASTPRSSWTTS